jgi:hypothetical protein
MGWKEAFKDFISKSTEGVFDRCFAHGLQLLRVLRQVSNGWDELTRTTRDKIRLAVAYQKLRTAEIHQDGRNAGGQSFQNHVAINIRAKGKNEYFHGCIAAG